MAAPIPLRCDVTAAALRHQARRTRDANQARRLLALAEIYDGGSRTDAARIGGVTLQIVRDWVLRFNALGPDGLRDRKAPGPTPTWHASLSPARPTHRLGLHLRCHLPPEGQGRWPGPALLRH
jgi:hypothetical protein